MPSDLRGEIAGLRQRLEASERQFQAVFHSAPDAMVVLDDQGRYLDANAAACVLYGRSRDDILRARVGDFSVRTSNHDPCAGAGFLHKPFTTEALARKVRDVLDSPAGVPGP